MAARWFRRTEVAAAVVSLCGAAQDDPARSLASQVQARWVRMICGFRRMWGAP